MQVDALAGAQAYWAKGLGFVMPTWVWIAMGAGVASVGVAWLVWTLLWDRARGRRRCAKCWYDMSAVAGLECPECGRVAKRERGLRRTRRRWLHAALAIPVLLAGVLTATWPELRTARLADAPLGVLNSMLWPFDSWGRRLYEQEAAISFGNVASGNLTQFEKLLIARRCGKIIREDGARLDGLRDSRSHDGGLLESLGSGRSRAQERSAAGSEAARERVGRREEAKKRITTAMNGIRGLGREAKPALPAVIELLDSKAWSVSEMARMTLRMQAQRHGAQVAPLIAARIDDVHTPEALLSLVDALRLLGPDGAPAAAPLAEILAAGSDHDALRVLRSAQLLYLLEVLHSIGGPPPEQQAALSRCEQLELRVYAMIAWGEDLERSAREVIEIIEEIEAQGDHERARALSLLVGLGLDHRLGDVKVRWRRPARQMLPSERARDLLGMHVGDGGD